MVSSTTVAVESRDSHHGASQFTREDIEEAIQSLQQLQDQHPIWGCRLIVACRAGMLTKEDFKHLFSQYYLYSKNFTRYLAALMMNCESDYYRSHLSENLWEEGGQAEPDQRHAELFRRFLRDSLTTDIKTIKFESFANIFFHSFLDFCRNASPLSASAFLSLGTEGAVPRLYGYFLEGLLKAGIPEEQLQFFRIHMECDDEHAITLAELMRSYCYEPGWFEQCKIAINHALDLRRQFFDDVLGFIVQSRLAAIFESIESEHSLLGKDIAPAALRYSASQAETELSELYRNRIDNLDIEFTVQRVGFGAEILDVRIVDIPPHKKNEHHRHAHESLLNVVAGEGRVLVDDHAIPVRRGDAIFVPRWAVHQTQNTGDQPMRLLAVTDYGLTRLAFLGDHLRTTRMNPTKDADAAVPNNSPESCAFPEP